MECIYIPMLSFQTQHYPIPPAECQHLKALRIQTGTQMQITNGNGLSAIAVIERISKTEYNADVIEFMRNFGELDCKIGLAIGILDNKDRLEFAVEKSVELGVSEIFLLTTDYTQQMHINLERLVGKAIAAVKQCKRSVLPIIHPPIKLSELLNANDYESIVLCDEKGVRPAKVENSSSILVFIGAEGGFSNAELDLFPANTLKWNLGNRRLRAETAAIVALGYLSGL
ncbi:MAG: 16S rRNA (uracil(1498)-N(3))-methyltransferase [Ignavibacteria bacterium]|jgi:16S rRNA (uracil1498-N3)-methyltransferase|nr:16S rRNA (uracil(1498)-N(3))-methyltransferase [Ignavibacteria bacterium]